MEGGIWELGEKRKNMFSLAALEDEQINQQRHVQRTLSKT